MRRNILSIIVLGVLVAMSTEPSVAQQRTLEDYISRSRNLYEGGNYREAQRELVKAKSAATALSRVSPVVTDEMDFLAACCEARLGDGAEAVEAFIAAHPSSPYLNEALHILGNEHYEWGRHLEAIGVLERVDMAKLTNDEVEELCFECGHCYYLLGDNGAARDWLQRLSRPGRLYDHSRYLLGYVAYSEGNYSEAREYFQRVASSSDYEAVVPYYLLNIEHRLGNYHYVLTHTEKVLEGLAGERRAEVRRAAADSAFALEQWEEAERHISLLASEEGTTPSREENYRAGYALYSAGRWADAAVYLRRACVGEDALARNAAYHLADCMLREGDKRSAMHCFSLAATGATDAIAEDAHYNFCKLQVEMGGKNFNEEIRTLSGYLRRYPQSKKRSEIEGYLISACYAANDLRAAYDILGEFVASGGKLRAAMQKIAYYHAAECFIRGNMEEAEEYCNRSLDHKEYDVEVEALSLYLLAELYYDAGKYKEAALMYDRYVAMDMTHQKEYPFALYNMGYARFNSGRFAAAYDDLRDFVEVRTVKDSYYADAYNRMGDAKAALKEYSAASKLYAESASTQTGECYYGAYRVAMMEGMAGNTKGRIRALEDIIALGSGNYVIRSTYELGNTLLMSGDYDRAVDVLSDFVKRYPSSRDYVAALSDLGLAYRNTGYDDAALDTYKQIVATTRGTTTARNAMEEIRNIYVERNDVDGFFAYAEGAGMSGDLGAVQRDSLGFVAAQRLYIAGKKEEASPAFDKYLQENSEGNYAAAALYYSADCRATLGDSLGAREQLTRLTSMYYNNYTQRGYERMAQLAAAGADWKAAASAYRSLAELAGSQAARREALGKYLETSVAAGDKDVIIAVADYIAAHEDVTEELNRKALFQKAVALEALGKRNPAVAIYNSLGEDVSTPEGAESAYRIIETAFKFGSFEKAESLVYEFAEKNTPHANWLARAFVLLGDVYTSRGDLFQARATYQSVVDGYSNKEDGIVDAARERIAALDGATAPVEEAASPAEQTEAPAAEGADESNQVVE